MAEQEPTTAARSEAPSAPQAPAVDVRKLAEKVYRLMQEDLRLERARGAPPARRDKAAR